MKASQKKKQQKQITSCVISSLALISCTWLGQGFLSESFAKEDIKLQKLYPKLDKLPPPVLLKTGIGTNVAIPANVNDFGYAQSSDSFPSKITFVNPRSNAWASGLQPNDKLINASFDTRGATLVVERNGKKYICQISAYKASSQPEKKPPPDEASKILLKHEIVLLVDSSASMNTKDCPSGKSRWQWCREQADNLLAKNLLAGKTTISIFSSNFSSHAHCRLDDLPGVFQNNSASGETFLAPALKDAITSVSSQLYAGRPALIAVITDGRPTDVNNVRKLLIDTANSLKDPTLLSITFIEIGTPEKYLREFDNELVLQGAKADIVSLCPFSEVNKKGMMNSLAQSAQRPRQTAQEPIASPAQVKLQAILKEAQDKKQQDEARSKVLQSAANKKYDFSNSKPKSPSPNLVPRKAIPLKAHPSGTLQSPSSAEVNERESVLKESANKTYSLPGKGTK